MRIIGGQWRGRRIEAPRGRDTRPTLDRVREAIFSSVYSLFGELEGCVVVDLYAGSGALGLEALSRGARRCVFVESDRKAAALITANARSLGASAEEATVVQASVNSALAARMRGMGASLLLADPPYRIEPLEFSQVLEGLATAGVLEHDALVVYEHSTQSDVVWPLGFTVRADRRYGDTVVSFATYEGNAST